MSTCLITGARGFVGTPLCRRLSPRWRVRAATRFVQPLDPGLVGAECCVGSIDGTTDWSEAVRDVDCVVHLAARVHVMHDTAADPLGAFRRVNLCGTIRLAKQAAAAGVRRFIYISTIKVNGDQSPAVADRGWRRLSVDDVPAPSDPYAVSKWEAEQALAEISRDTGMELVVIRPPLVYGPGVKGNFRNLLKLLKCRIPLPLAGVANLRSLVYVGNLADAIAAVMESPRTRNRTYLISDGEDVSTPQLIRRLAEVMGRRPLLFPVPRPCLYLTGRMLGKEDAIDRLVTSLVVDSEPIRNELNWSPPFSLAEGLHCTAAWFISAGNREDQPWRCGL